MSDLRTRASPEFTLRAVIIGLLIGCLLCFTNLSFGLQTGWISMMSLQSALIGYLISRLLPTGPLSAQEVIVVQTTAVATGTMPLAAGFVGIIPALKLLEPERDGSEAIDLSWLAAAAWSCAVAFFGVFLSPPIRKQVIVKEQLAFPSGTATAQLIAVLHEMPPPDTTIRRRVGYTAIEAEDLSVHPIVRDEDEVGEETPLYNTAAPENVQSEGWRALGYSFLASGALTLFAYFFPAVFSIPLFGTYLARNWLWTFTPSLAYVGQGVIMGFSTTVSMALGMIVGWGILSPISKLSGWAPGPVGDMTNGARGWILWTSLAIMCSDSLVSLMPVIFEYVSGFGRRTSPESKEDPDTETEDRLVPTSWVVVGVISSVVVGTFLVWLVFGHDGIKPWATLLGFIFGGFLSILGVRALGETDINPVSGLGKISQLLFAWIQPGNIVANIIAGGVAEAGAQQAGDLMQDLKTGHLCGASPRAQFYGQLVGSCVSILVTTTGYALYNRAYEIPGPSFPAPTAYVWLSLARLLRDGELPERTAGFMVGFAALFALISGVKSYAAQRHVWWHTYLPSGVAFAVGFLNTPSFTLARLIGGIVEYVYRTRYAKGRGDIRLIIVASGFVLGEGVLAKIPALTFYKNEWTEGRRTSPIPQLTCVGKPCSLFTPDVVRCESLGGSGTEIDWKCTADLPDSLRLGRVEVGCEGWSKAGDPYVLKGSCALEYRLVQVPGTLRNSNSDNFSQKSDTMSAAFMIFWLVVVGVILYALYASCMDTDTNRHRAPSPPRTRPDTGGFFPWRLQQPTR
ncbi:Oligopeptide transporter [Mycena kentingensis (nom. inval.)]|nr:Oligopeptide transporter [Mycena kentingensis (nom. inval.)]